MQVLNYFAKKQQNSTLVFLAIAKRIARVAKAANDKLELIMAATAKQDSIGVVTLPIPTYDAPAMGIALVFEAAAPLPSDHALRQRIAHVRAFWSALRVRRISCTQERGSTWLELFVLFAISGGTACAALAEHLRQSHAKQLNAFRNISRLFFNSLAPRPGPSLSLIILKVVLAGGPWPVTASRLSCLPYHSSWL